MLKIITWIMVNTATLFGCIQAIIKAAKELATGVINLLSLFMPNVVASKLVIKVRGIFNTIDKDVEWVKKFLIK